MLPRILEPELMDTAEDASEYDAMDHAAVNAQFVDDLLAAIDGVGSLLRPETVDNCQCNQSQKTPDPFRSPPLTVLDLGAGTAQIPIELCRRAPNVHVVAIDAAESMLAIARENVEAAGLAHRIELIHADAKSLPVRWAPPTNDERATMVGNAARLSSPKSHPTNFPVVMSNSILHHIAEPRDVIAGAIDATVPGGFLFHRDLCRPRNEAEVERIVTAYAAGATPHQRKLFSDSLRAAVTVEEMRDLVANFGFAPDTVQMTSDRHWTWSATRV